MSSFITVTKIKSFADDTTEAITLNTAYIKRVEPLNQDSETLSVVVLDTGLCLYVKEKFMDLSDKLNAMRVLS